jgi:hypothetical protein
MSTVHNCTSPKPFLVRKNQGTAVSPELLKDALLFIADSTFTEFASGLDDARIYWRNYRALVEAPRFPDFLLGPLRHSQTAAPGETSIDSLIFLEDGPSAIRACAKANAITPEVYQELLPEAERTANVWLTNGVAERLEAERAEAEQTDYVEVEIELICGDADETDEPAEPESEPEADPDARAQFQALASEALQYLHDSELGGLIATLECYISVAKRDGRQPRTDASLPAAALLAAPAVLAAQAPSTRRGFLTSLGIGQS